MTLAFSSLSYRPSQPRKVFRGKMTQMVLLLARNNMMIKAPLKLLTATLFGLTCLTSYAQAQFHEEEYATVKGWTIYAAWVAPDFAYCSAETATRGYHLRIASDDQNQWVIGTDYTDQNTQGRMSIDSASDIVAFESLSIGDGRVFTPLGDNGLDMLRQGNQLSIIIDNTNMSFSLSGSYAASLKVQECAQRKGVRPQTSQPTQKPSIFNQSSNKPTTQAPSNCSRKLSSGLCVEQANRLINVVAGSAPSLPKGCTWVINDAQFVDQTVLYYAAQCNGVISKLEYGGGARFAELSLAQSALGSSLNTRMVLIGSAEQKNPHENILGHVKRAMEDKTYMDQCYAQPAKGNGYPADSYIVDLSAKQVNALSPDGPRDYYCGPLGAGDTQSFWRAFGGWVWYFDLGQGAYSDIDPRSLTVVEKHGNQWKVIK